MTAPESAETFTPAGLLDVASDVASEASGLVVAHLWEPRCAACRATLPSIGSLARLSEERGLSGHGLTIGTLDVSAHPEVAKAMGIESLPVVVALQDGGVKSSIHGAEAIQQFLRRVEAEVFGNSGPPPSE